MENIENRKRSSIRITGPQLVNLHRELSLEKEHRLKVRDEKGLRAVKNAFGCVVPPVISYESRYPAEFERKHPAPFDEREIIDHIEFLTEPGDRVLDIMCGSGTTLSACYKTGRQCLGIELMPQWIAVAKERIYKVTGKSYEWGNDGLHLLKGDCRELLPKIQSNHIDLIITSPPYFNILKKVHGWRAADRHGMGLSVDYGESTSDLGNIDDYGRFLAEVGNIYGKCLRVLKPSRYMVVIVSDIVKNNEIIPFHADNINIARNAGFQFEQTQVILDHWKLERDQRKANPMAHKFHHHYALIFKKPEHINIHNSIHHTGNSITH